MAKTLTELPKVGEKVRYLGGEKYESRSGLEVGGIYEVIEEDLRDEKEADVTIRTGRDNLSEWYIYGENHLGGSDLHKYELVEDSAEAFKVGDEVKYVGVSEIGNTRGAIYTVRGFTSNGTPFYYDNIGRTRYLLSGLLDRFELVTGETPREIEPSESLLRRLDRIEKHLGFKRPLATRITALESENSSLKLEMNDLYNRIAELEALI